MRLLFYLGHPAHFHLFKNVITYFKNHGNDIHILIKKKDILEELLQDAGLAYVNIYPKTHGNSKPEMIKTVLKREYKLFSYCRKHKPDILIGTSVENSHIGTLLGIPSINVNEDDFDVVPYYSKLSYPLSSVIISPSSCRMGKWENKTVHYSGYHELTYLHPNYFKPDKDIASKYIDLSKPCFLLRFAKLTAHHDNGIKGLEYSVASKIVEKISHFGNVYISSERKLEPEFEPYRIKINPLDMHHVMAHVKFFIGDSQTMAAESAVLGTPYIRFNDFVGRIGYLNELENKYKLGFGIRTDNTQELIDKTDYLLHLDDYDIFRQRREMMLSETIDVTAFLTWFIETYPNSKAQCFQNRDFLNRFKTKKSPDIKPKTNPDNAWKMTANQANAL